MDIYRKGKIFEIIICLKNRKKSFFISNNFQNNIYNILAALAVISINENIFKLNKNFFLDFQVPEGRGDFLGLK